MQTRIQALLLILLGVIVGYALILSGTKQEPKLPFQLGLDLSGGSYLVYEADVSALQGEGVDDSLDALRDVIERRVNLFGVSEPRVSIEKSSLAEESVQNRLVVELPGITDIDEAIKQIGQTPLLEFKIENPEFDVLAYQSAITEYAQGDHSDSVVATIKTGEHRYLDTDLTGRYLKRSSVIFPQSGGVTPQIQVEFDATGSEIFAELTSAHIGETIAIYLDGTPISTPVVQTGITGGTAVITGNFTPAEAKQLSGRLNSGALPVPIHLISTQTIGPSLGAGAVDAGVMAGIIGMILIAVFLILWYRLPGLFAVISLLIYSAVILMLFKLIPVTLTSAGIAGFILSLGIAVDANVLIFERVKEELRAGQTVHDAVREGFSRAWPSIRDANISSLISAVILFWFGTSLIQGFALTFGLGVLVSMLTAITVTRILLMAISGHGNSPALRFLHATGFSGGSVIIPDSSHS